MFKVTRRDFLIMMGAGLAGLIGGYYLPKPLLEEKTKYITNITVNPNEFIIIPFGDLNYVGLGGVGLIAGEEADFVDELMSKNISQIDNFDIHSLPKKEDGEQVIQSEVTISTMDNLNYEITSTNKDFISNIQKYSSDILNKNNELFGNVEGAKTR